MTDDGAFIAEASAAAGRETSVLLRAVSHPEFGDILIDATPFAVGRNELPFASYDKDVVAALSRRHARIFWEGGELYVADLGSKNGTKVNGAAVMDTACRLHERDELRFGDLLSYRVKLLPRARTPRRAGTLLSLTLTPERDDLLLEPIVITRFPFLVGKIDDVFARYKDAYPHQVTYVSRRHAHIFLKDDVPFVEDLGSTNGTFVGGTRLDERAVELHDGDVLAFGGSHFVYKVGLQREVETEPTLTRFRPSAPSADDGNADRTTFVAAPDSFLDIFCLAQPSADEAPAEAAPRGDNDARPTAKRERRAAVFAREFGRAFAGEDRRAGRRALKWGLPVLLLIAAAAVGLRLAGSDERELETLVAAGDYVRAATVADAQLARDPGDAGVKTIGTDAILKAKLPQWIGEVDGGKFDDAGAVLADMKAQVRHNPEAQALLAELGWVADIERFVRERGGADAPIRIHTDEAAIRALVGRWQDDAKAHQRALSRVANVVPEFRELHAEALTHLRRLESDESVYLAAIDRLDETIASELAAGRAEALGAVLDDYAGKYPRLAGIDRLREDLRQYVALDRDLRERRLGALVTRLATLQFATPPFQRQFAQLGAGALPSAETVSRYRRASDAWRKGETAQALDALRRIDAGPWADAATDELARKEAIARAFAALQQGGAAKASGGKGSDAGTRDERLLAFHASLEPEEDVFFVRATAAEVGSMRGKALARATGLLDRAEGTWSAYRTSGGIGGEQRLESSVSPKFREQARRLADAHADATQGVRIHEMLNADVAERWRRLADEIDTEAALQRQSLQELHMVLEPGVLQAKLALIGGRSDEERKQP